MGGEILDYEAKRIYNEAKSDIITTMLKKNITPEEIHSYTDIPLEDIEKQLLKMRGCVSG